MDRLKTKLLMEAVLLLFAATVLTSVSYAWITLSTNPVVTGLNTSASANQNLEIALDDGYETMLDVDVASSDADGVQGSMAGDPYTWGNYIDLGKAFDSENVMLQQVKYTQGNPIILEYPLYGHDGRLLGLDTLEPVPISDYEGKGTKGGVRIFKAKDGAEGVKESDNPNYAYSITYWMRTNVAGSVYLSEETKRADDGSGTTTGVNGEMGKGSCIRIPIVGNDGANVLDRFVSNIRIIFVEETGDETKFLFEASIGQGEPVEEGGVKYRRYELFTTPAEAGENPLYKGSDESMPIGLEANQARKITMYAYLNGADLTNAEALLYEVSGLQINVQFANSNIDEGGAMTGDTDPNSVYEE